MLDMVDTHIAPLMFDLDVVGLWSIWPRHMYYTLPTHYAVYTTAKHTPEVKVRAGLGSMRHGKHNIPFFIVIFSSEMVVAVVFIL